LNQFGAQQQQELNTVLPFYQQEAFNPQGIGPQGLAQGKSAISGATSAAAGTGKNAGNLLAARTGNPTNASAIQDVTARNAMQTEGNQNLALNLENSNLQQQQQQAGQSGIQNVYNTEMSNALASLGLSNQSIGAQNAASSANENAWLAPLKIAGQLGSAATGAATGV